MGSLSELAYEYRGSGVQIVGLVADVYSAEGGSIDKARQLMESAGASHKTFIATDSVKSTMLQGVNMVPTTKFYDSSGRLLTVVHGAKSKEKWINIIETVVHEKA